MATPTKTYVDKIVENQNKLFNTLSHYANEAVDTMVPDQAHTEKATAIAQALVQQPMELMEEMTKQETMEKFQQDFWGNYQALTTKSMQNYMDLYQQSFQYMQAFMGSAMGGQQQEKARKLNDIMQQCMKAWMDTTAENARIVQEYFN